MFRPPGLSDVLQLLMSSVSLMSLREHSVLFNVLPVPPAETNKQILKTMSDEESFCVSVKCHSQTAITEGTSILSVFSQQQHVVPLFTIRWRCNVTSKVYFVLLLFM